VKIHFSNVNFSSRTGPNTFAHRLAEELTARDHQIVSENDPYDVFLAFIEPASRPKPTARFIQRLDGIWFKPEQFETHNVRIKWTYDNAHHVIWQSQFDRDMTEHHWGQRQGRVIRNGIKLKSVPTELDPAILSLKISHSHLFSCSANWHPQKRLTDNVRLFQEIRKSHLDAALVILGSNPQVSPGTDLTNVYAIGNVSHEQCLAIYDASDWMIHLAWLDHCPNVVVEALSRHCPVICSKSGGTWELVRNRGFIIKDEPYNFELTDYDKPPSVNVEGFILPDRPRVIVEDLDIKCVADQYEKVLRGSYESP